jgi:hypothetical protein
MGVYLFQSNGPCLASFARSATGLDDGGISLDISTFCGDWGMTGRHRPHRRFRINVRDALTAAHYTRYHILRYTIHQPLLKLYSNWRFHEINETREAESWFACIRPSDRPKWVVSKLGRSEKRTRAHEINSSSERIIVNRSLASRG